MSKELRALERMEYILKVNCHHYKQDVGYIREALIKAQEQEKVLEIIKEKNVDILALKDCIERELMGNIKSALEYYNENYYTLDDGLKLTEEEFDLLKRWLNEKN